MRIALVSIVAVAAALVACGKGGGASKWADHKGDIPFVVGQDAGMRSAKASGRPPMYFFTATW